jgi:hypothetical protein
MIPSLNNQAVTEADYPKKGGVYTYEQLLAVIGKLPYVCDCCRKHVSGSALGMSDTYWDHTINPRLVKVSEVTYFGCSTECARVLFDIHSRYELLEKGGPAAPGGHEPKAGMMLRDRFAAMALAGTLSSGNHASSSGQVAAVSYLLADIMIVTRSLSKDELIGTLDEADKAAPQVPPIEMGERR